ncbi:MAG: 1-acyl-sn-glycerol-3-phosphate acyltransferase [Acidobacteria bacterium]|nr:1-acyl-sn-glycerol-3-phosphate acyltransferase [Acidobacteriota bacterium]
MKSFIILNVIRPIVKLIFKLMYGLEAKGLENIPATGAVVFTPNHISYIDPVLVGALITRRVYFMTWDEMLKIPILGSIGRWFGAYPVKLEGHDRFAVKLTQDHLKAGRAVGIFPEGGRTVSGKLDPFKQGAFRLSLRGGVPIIPVTINGAYDIWPPEQKFPKLTGKVTIYFHSPIYLPNASGAELKEHIPEIIERVRESIISTLEEKLIPDDAKIKSSS